MLKFICSVALSLSLIGCSGGAKGDGKTRPITPLSYEAMLINHQPVGGYDSHFPLVQYFEYDNVSRKLVDVLILDELINTFSWATFKTSKFGQALVGAMFINGSPKADIYLWFQIRLGATQEVAEYRLNLTFFPKDNLVSGFETITIGKDEPTRISVEYTIK